MAASDHLSPAQFKVKITPAQANALSAERGGSEYLGHAEDAGVTWTNSSLTIPHEAVPHMSGFLNMRRELASDYRNYEDWKTPEETGHHRAFENLHKRASDVLGDRMRGH